MKNENVVISMIDSLTGEIIEELSPGDTYRVIRDKDRKEGEETVAFPFTSFVKLNYAEFSEIIKELSPPEVRVLMGCINFLGYSDNCVKSRKGRPLSIFDIAQVLNVSHKTVDRAIASLIEKDILYRGVNSKEFQLFVCPLIAGRGTRHNKVLQTMFRNYRVRSNGNIRWHRLLEREVE